jgi:hypothetical protein
VAAEEAAAVVETPPDVGCHRWWGVPIKGPLAEAGSRGPAPSVISSDVGAAKRPGAASRPNGAYSLPSNGKNR